MGTPKTWKAVERRVCRFLGMDRTPLSGGNGRITRADCRTCGPNSPTDLFVEVKHGGGCPRTWGAAERLFLATEKLAVLEGKTAVIVLHFKGKADVAQYPAYMRLPTGNNAAGEVVQVPLSTVKRLLITGHEAIGKEGATPEV